MIKKDYSLDLGPQDLPLANFPAIALRFEFDNPKSPKDLRPER